MGGHSVLESLPPIDHHSYYLGITTAFVEVVAMGCKRLALSPPYTSADLAVLLAPTQHLVKTHQLALFVEPELLITPLFPADIAVDRTVILIAGDQRVLDAYHDLVAQRRTAITAGRLAEVEPALAWQFGRLLSYSDAAIQRLLDAQSH